MRIEESELEAGRLNWLAIAGDPPLELSCSTDDRTFGCPDGSKSFSA